MATGFGSELERLLSGLGLAGVQERDHVVEAVEAQLRDHGLDARVASVRWGRVVVEADQPTVAKLAFHRASLESLIRDRSAGELTELRFRVRKGSTA